MVIKNTRALTRMLFSYSPAYPPKKTTSFYQLRICNPFLKSVDSLRNTMPMVLVAFQKKRCMNGIIIVVRKNLNQKRMNL